MNQETLSIQGEGGIEKRLEKYDWNFPKSNSSKNIHSIHPYPAKFIPEIPEALIKELPVPKGTVIFDPFCGSGVTLVEAQEANVESVGVDLNPIACLISRVKTKPLPENFLRVANKCFSQGNLNFEEHKPNIPNLNHWFKLEVQDAIADLLFNINLVKDGRDKDCLNLALSSILVKVSNQDSDTRYAAVSKKIKKDDVYNLFLLACKKLSKILNCDNKKKPTAKVIQKNILELNPSEIKKPVGLVITSPPYPNAYEYWLYHKYRMWWLGYDPVEIKNKEIGARAHYFKKNHQTPVDFYNQMAKVFKLLSELVVPSGYICFVIGRSQIHGVEVDNAKTLETLAKENGFLAKHTIRRIIAPNRKSFNLAYGKIKTEDILIFKKP